jgi:hypothetical protein
MKGRLIVGQLTLGRLPLIRLSRAAKSGPNNAVIEKLRKLMTPVAVPLCSGDWLP